MEIGSAPVLTGLTPSVSVFFQTARELSKAKRRLSIAAEKCIRWRAGRKMYANNPDETLTLTLTMIDGDVFMMK
jgi:hypothetical protein